MRPLTAAVAALLGLGLVAAWAVTARDSRATRPAPPTTTVPAGTVRIEGTLDALALDGADGPPLAPPLVLVAPVRGEGGAELAGVTVGGRDAAVVWDGGRPLPVSGTGAIDPAPASVALHDGALRWSLDGAPRPLAPGRYQLGATVAVGAAGLAQPRDDVVVVAGPGASLTSHGGVYVDTRPDAITLTGEGRLRLAGQLRRRDATSEVDVSELAGEGRYEVTLRRGADGRYAVTASIAGTR